LPLRVQKFHPHSSRTTLRARAFTFVAAKLQTQETSVASTRVAAHGWPPRCDTLMTLTVLLKWQKLPSRHGVLMQCERARKSSARKLQFLLGSGKKHPSRCCAKTTFHNSVFSVWKMKGVWNRSRPALSPGLSVDERCSGGAADFSIGGAIAAGFARPTGSDRRPWWSEIRTHCVIGRRPSAARRLLHQ